MDTTDIVTAMWITCITSTRKTSSSMCATMRQSPTRYRHSGTSPRGLPGSLSGTPRERGSSIAPTRLCRSCVMRRATGLSSARRSFSAPASNSIRQAKLALHLLQRVRP